MVVAAVHNPPREPERPRVNTKKREREEPKDVEPRGGCLKTAKMDVQLSDGVAEQLRALRVSDIL